MGHDGEPAHEIQIVRIWEGRKRGVTRKGEGRSLHHIHTELAVAARSRLGKGAELCRRLGTSCAGVPSVLAHRSVGGGDCHPVLSCDLSVVGNRVGAIHVVQGGSNKWDRALKGDLWAVRVASGGSQVAEGVHSLKCVSDRHAGKGRFGLLDSQRVDVIKNVGHGRVSDKRMHIGLVPAGLDVNTIQLGVQLVVSRVLKGNVHKFP
mmetsp:Transcript_8608/g.29556  ORF Transcript_8608/g.29556 Transcript_8608/m.29556 type:complete len:206 (-) Transcript_8608:986-1603(-)